MKFRVVFAKAEDHFTVEGGLGDALESRANVWATGILLHSDAEKIVVAMGGAKFDATALAEQTNLSLFTIRAPYHIETIGEVDL